MSLWSWSSLDQNVLREHGGGDDHNVEAGILHPWPDEDCLPVNVNVNPAGRPRAVGTPVGSLEGRHDRGGGAEHDPLPNVNVIGDFVPDI